MRVRSSAMSGIASSSSCSDHEFVYIKRKGGTILLRGGHQYYVRRKHNSGLTVWTCIKRKICKGLMRIKDQRILEECAHSSLCEPNFAKNEIDESLDKLKQQLTQPECPNVPTCYNSMVGNLKGSGLDIITKIPNFNSIKNSLYRHRNSVAQVSKLQSKNAQEVEVPFGYKDFISADYLDDNKRILVFAALESRQTMSELTDFFCDGTFRSCPTPFAELYTIHGDIGSNVDHTNIIPLVYALLSDRTTSTYVILSRLILSQIPNWLPTTFKVDYEKAMMKAIGIVFPSAIIKGCYFHYNKAIFKKGKEMDRLNPKQMRLVGLCAVLPLLPEEKILEGWAYIYKRYGVGEDIHIRKFIKYMEKQWLRDDFIKVWCVYGDTHRTTNFLEGWHNKLNKAVGKKSSNLMQLLHVLKEDASLYTVRNIQKKNNVTPKRKRSRNTVLNDEFIQEAQLELIEGSVTVGHVLDFAALKEYVLIYDSSLIMVITR